MQNKKSGNTQEPEHQWENVVHDMGDKDFANILWTYFTQHSNQRMQMMNFYIVLETFLFTGMLTLYNATSESDKDFTIIYIGICIAVIFFSFVFLNLDRRTRELIHICEESIKALEGEYGQFDEKIRIVSYEARLTCARGKGNKKAQECKNNVLKPECRCGIKKRFPLLYTESFRLIYLFFSISAIIFIIFFLKQLEMPI